MKFSEILNNYIEQLDCKAKDICEKSDISAATLSRYRSGERLPDPNSETLRRLCAAISEIARERCIEGICEEQILEEFSNTEDFESLDTKQLFENFDMLVNVLNININKLCRYINYDVSTVFRFRNGTRKPAEPKKFAFAVAGYIVREFDSAKDISVLSKLLVCSEEEIADNSIRFDRLTNWMLSEKAENKTSVSSFLNKLNEFDLNEYIKSIHFDELKVPSVPFQIPNSKTYFGLTEMMESELDFLKATVLSKSMEPVTMYSDMPMSEMAKDPEFPKKWMFGMAMMLKKGLHLNQIHNIDRSFDEMMLGLEGWIPMYMTGQISPYYLKNAQNNVFLHFLKVSGAAALSGEAITGYHSDGKYYLTKSKKEIAYYSKRAKELLECASPLMDIYRSDKANELNAFLIADSEKAGNRRSILSALPIYTMSDALLESVLNRYGITGDEKRSILDFVISKRRRVETILESNTIADEIPELTKDDFIRHPLSLDLSGAFCEQDILYTYEEYLEHLKSTEQFTKTHTNYTLKKTSSHAFINLQIIIHEGKWAMISKSKSPSIHFVVRHPKLLNAIESFIPPVMENRAE